MLTRQKTVRPGDNWWKTSAARLFVPSLRSEASYAARAREDRRRLLEAETDTGFLTKVSYL